MHMMHQGSCLCSAVTWSLARPMRIVTHCHCTMCRKQHGAGFATYAQVKRAALTIADPKAQLRRYASSEKAARLFCATCGSSLFWESSDHPELLGVAVGTLDGPLDVPIFAHIFTGNKADWVAISDGVPCHEGDYVGPPAPRDA